MSHPPLEFPARPDTAPSWRGTAVAAIPVAVAIGVFGVIYGAVAAPLLGPFLAVASSLIIFSGAAQFTLVALLAAGASPAGVIGAAALLALRHAPLGAVLLPRIRVSRWRRVLLSWFLLDETTGLALARSDHEPPERTLLIGGALAYSGWVAGTVLGVAGAAAGSLEPLAAALFPVLFVGLAALTARTRGDGVRAAMAAVVTLGLLLAWPALGALGAVAVAAAVAAVPGR